MAEGTLLEVFVPKELAPDVERAEGIEIRSQRPAPDEGLQFGFKEAIEISAFLTTGFEVVKLALELLLVLKRRGNKDEKAVLRSPRGGEVQIYSYEEEEVVRRKVERVFIQRR